MENVAQTKVNHMDEYHTPLLVRLFVFACPLRIYTMFNHDSKTEYMRNMKIVIRSMNSWKPTNYHEKCQTIELREYDIDQFLRIILFVIEEVIYFHHISTSSNSLASIIMQSDLNFNR